MIWYTARTEVDKVNRVVTLADFQLATQDFPTIANNGAAYAGAFNKDLTWTQSVPLDELQSRLAVTSVAEKQQKVKVKNNPSTTFFSTAPRLSWRSLMDNRQCRTPDKGCKKSSTRAH